MRSVFPNRTFHFFFQSLVSRIYLYIWGEVVPAAAFCANEHWKSTAGRKPESKMLVTSPSRSSFLAYAQLASEAKYGGRDLFWWRFEYACIPAAGVQSEFIIDSAAAGQGVVAVTVEGPSKVQMECLEVAGGYKVLYTPMAPGSYIVAVKYGGPYHIAGSPFVAKVTGRHALWLLLTPPSVVALIQPSHHPCLLFCFHLLVFDFPSFVVVLDWASSVLVLFHLFSLFVIGPRFFLLISPVFIIFGSFSVLFFSPPVFCPPVSLVFSIFCFLPSICLVVFCCYSSVISLSSCICQSLFFLLHPCLWYSLSFVLVWLCHLCLKSF